MNSFVETTPSVRIVTAADKNYLMYLACHLASLGRIGVSMYPMIITVIHKEIDRSTQLELEKLIPAPHQLHWFEPHLEALANIKAFADFAHLSPHYYRLLIPFILPKCPRALYLDADTLILKDLLPLWNLNLEGHAVAAVQDYIPHISEAVANWEFFHLDPNAPYFNSGVLLMDLEAWRKDSISERVLNVCQKHAELLLAQGKWPQYDQYGLNIILYKNWKEISKTWNYGTDKSPANAHVIHFIGNGKIGLPTCHPFFSQFFYKILQSCSIDPSFYNGALK